MLTNNDKELTNFSLRRELLVDSALSTMCTVLFYMYRFINIVT